MKQTAPIVINDPCIRCGKPLSADYAGFCMPVRPPEWSGAGGDCSDSLGISELNNHGEPNERELKIIKQYREKKDVRARRHNPRK